jgi:hypothetical protein
MADEWIEKLCAEWERQERGEPPRENRSVSERFSVAAPADHSTGAILDRIINGLEKVARRLVALEGEVKVLKGQLDANRRLDAVTARLDRLEAAEGLDALDGARPAAGTLMLVS